MRSFKSRAILRRRVLAVHGPFLLGEKVVRHSPDHLPHPLPSPLDTENAVADLGEAVSVLDRVGKEAV